MVKSQGPNEFTSRAMRSAKHDLEAIAGQNRPCEAGAIMF